MVAPVLKALGALVVGAPAALVLGLTARSLRKQEDAAVPVIPAKESPLSVTVYSNYLDKKTHELLSPKSLKKGFVAYDVRVDNRTGQAVRGVHLELLDGDDDVVGEVRLGEIEAHGHTVFAAKKSWNRAFEKHRITETGAPRVVLTWKTPEGRRRAVVAPSPLRVLGETPSEIRRRRRERAPITARVMS
jgi:hypothetical protein